MKTESRRFRPVISLLTDFGRADHFVGVMKGVIAGICPQALVIDISHQVPPQDIQAGALTLLFSYCYFPVNTIHLAVVDPGVGTDRAIVACRTQDYIFLAPDNGILSPILERAGLLEAVRIENKKFLLADVSCTFHGRDIFAPVAAHLANGVSLSELGSPVEELVQLRLPQLTRPSANVIRGEIIYIDHFGNLISNVPGEMVEELVAKGGKVRTQIAGVTVEGLSQSYVEVPEGELLVLLGSTGFLEVAARGARAEAISGAIRGDPVEIMVL